MVPKMYSNMLDLTLTKTGLGGINEDVETDPVVLTPSLVLTAVGKFKMMKKKRSEVFKIKSFNSFLMRSTSRQFF